MALVLENSPELQENAYWRTVEPLQVELVKLPTEGGISVEPGKQLIRQLQVAYDLHRIQPAVIRAAVSFQNEYAGKYTPVVSPGGHAEAGKHRGNYPWLVSTASEAAERFDDSEQLVDAMVHLEAEQAKIINEVIREQSTRAISILHLYDPIHEAPAVFRTPAPTSPVYRSDRDKDILSHLTGKHLVNQFGGWLAINGQKERRRFGKPIVPTWWVRAINSHGLPLVLLEFSDS